jgi:hypothetical protein
MAKLDDSRIAWTIKSKGRFTDRDIAIAANLSTSRVLQLYREYRRNNSMPKLKKTCRKRRKISEEERIVIRKLYGIYNANTCYVGKILDSHGFSINI